MLAVMTMSARLRAGATIRQRGFTLVEIMVVAALIAILLSVGVPSFVAFQRSSELRSSASSFLAAVQATRAEAMKRGVDAYMIPASNDSWASGWIVYADVDLNQSLDRAKDTVVMETGAIASRTSVATGLATASGFAGNSGSYIRFNGGGFSIDTSGAFRSGAIEFNVSGSTDRRRVVVNNVGRVRMCDPVKDTSTECQQGGGG
jgi:type IV fimbrial biogenesis protein FimT